MYRLLDARVATMLIRSGQKYGADGKICMRDNDWKWALDSSAGTGQVYSTYAGLANRA